MDVVCVATPDDRHFDAARQALAAGKHVLIEKPSVLRLQELDELDALAHKHQVLAKVVYHKLADPDHKKLRTHVLDGVLRHVNNGYCSLLEPKSISRKQFAEWIVGRNPGTYVAVHYVKLIDFTFGAPHARLARVSATGQRGLVGPADGPTWDSVQLQMVYAYPDGREAAFDIHTELGRSRRFPRLRRTGSAVPVSTTASGTPTSASAASKSRWRAVRRESIKSRPTTTTTPFSRSRGVNAANAATVWRSFAASSRRSPTSSTAAPPDGRGERLRRMGELAYNDLSADRTVVATVQAMEAILRRHADGRPGCQAVVNGPAGGLVLHAPGRADGEVLYAGKV